ncbi:MAG: GGDEF and EAL domain-containing protein [Cellvibrionales bacterium]|jgi:diguanylate cyclase (GGDEF)-like protein|nr:GGDEF and EAL domain-containing protein [Cellvibrionales bacterium]MBT5922411.1 GGDEF and EAL domain-containing protein [Cellvibrionales bacterium]
MTQSSIEIELSYLRKKISREKDARMQAEVLLERKSTELFGINQRLLEANQNLDVIVARRTQALKTSTKRVEVTSDELQNTVNRLNLVLDIANAVTWLFDVRNQTMDIAGKSQSLLGIEPTRGIPADELLLRIHKDDAPGLIDELNLSLKKGKAINIRCRILSRCGSYRWFLINGELSSFGAKSSLCVIGSCIEMHEQVEREREIWRVANHDLLTGLPNRNHFETQFSVLANDSLASGEGFTAALIDLNDFTQINDTYGYSIGDGVLRDFADVLRGYSDYTSHVARLSGDEYVVIFKNNVATWSAHELCQKLIDECATMSLQNGERLGLSLTMGLAVFPKDGTSLDDLMQSVYSAVQVGKQKKHIGSSCVLYNAAIERERFREKDIRNALKLAIEKQSFDLAFQPIMCNEEESFVGCEALFRWPDMDPQWDIQEVIDVAENSGLILDLGEQVIAMAFAKLSQLSEMGVKKWVAINISPLQFQFQDIPQLISKALVKHNVDPSMLVVEVTENIFLENITRIAAVLSELKKMGVRVSIDDFGSGYSSLRYVQMLPIDKIKIDKAFIDDVGSGVESQGIVQAVINMSHSMGYKVVAEGVETQEQLMALKSMGCDYIQGYFFSKPVNFDELIKLEGFNKAPPLVLKTHLGRTL